MIQMRAIAFKRKRIRAKWMYIFRREEYDNLVNSIKMPRW